MEKNNLLVSSKDKQNGSGCWRRVLERLNAFCQSCGAAVCCCCKKDPKEPSQYLESEDHKQDKPGCTDKIRECGGKVLGGLQACLSFFCGGDRKSRRNRSLGNALQEYTRTVAHQHAAVTDIQTALTNCLSDLEAHNRELSSKIKEIVSDDQAFFQSRLTKRGSEEYKATPAELSQSEKITKLQEMLRTYPELPEEGNLTAYDVDNITEARVEHHAVVMNLAADCLKDSYIGQQYQASSGLLHS